MNILLISSGFILAFIIVLYYKSRIRNISTKPKNNVHFYVARDKDDKRLCLYLSKPRRYYGYFMPCDGGRILVGGKSRFHEFGLNPADFSDLKWEDEPVEIFLNLED